MIKPELATTGHSFGPWWRTLPASRVSTPLRAMLLFGIAGWSAPAWATCTISNLNPGSGTTLTRLEPFSYLLTTDCVSSQVAVVGNPGTIAPTSAGTVAGRNRMRLVPTAAQWARWTAASRATIVWRVTATDRSGATVEASATVQLDLDADGYTRTSGDSGGCDSDATRNPGVTEWCDGVDNDCDGTADESLTTYAHLDADGDGYGVGPYTLVCSDDPRYVTDSSDCDDTDPGISPGQVDACFNGVDDDCDGTEACILGPTYASDAEVVLEYDLDPDGDPSTPELTSLGYLATEVRTCDFDGDGLADLLAGPGTAPDGDGSGTSSTLHLVLAPFEEPIALNDAVATFTISGEGYAAAFDCGDVTGDDIPDVVVSRYNPEPGDFDGVVEVFAGPFAGPYEDADASATIRGETFAITNNEVNGGRCEAVDYSYSAGVGFNVTAVGDYDGDGTGDLAIWMGSFPWAVETSFWDSSDGPCLRVDRFDWGATLVFLGPLVGEVPIDDAFASLSGYLGDAADADGDGVQDLFLEPLFGASDQTIFVTPGGLSGAWYLPGTSSTALARVAAVDRQTATMTGSLAAADFDSDGFVDLVVGGMAASASASEVYLLPGPLTGDLSASSDAIATLVPPAYTTCPGSQVGPAGDVNGDGVPDLLVHSSSCSPESSVSWVFAGPLSGTFTEDAAYGTIEDGYGSSWMGASLGDQNGDGKDDLVLANHEAAYIVHGE